MMIKNANGSALFIDFRKNPMVCFLQVLNKDIRLQRNTTPTTTLTGLVCFVSYDKEIWLYAI